MCSAHATVRGFLGEIAAGVESDRPIVVDMEAGLGSYVGRRPVGRSSRREEEVAAVACS